MYLDVRKIASFDVKIIKIKLEVIHFRSRNNIGKSLEQNVNQ